MKEIKTDVSLIAKCGLYCGSCKRYLKGKCPACTENEKASWCKIRLCTIKKGILNCSDCDEYKNVMDCSIFNNFMSRFFGVILNSDRNKCIDRIKELGMENYAQEMVENKMVTLKRR